MASRIAGAFSPIPAVKTKPSMPSIEKMLYHFDAHLFLTDQVENNARIELTRPRAHGQSIKRRKAHRVLNALSGRNRAHRSTATEVRDDDVEALCNILVREAVKTVAAHAFVVEHLRKGKSIGNFPMLATKGSIKAGNLQEVRLSIQYRSNWRDVVWLMQWSKRRKPLKLVEQGGIDGSRLAVLGPP